MTHHNSQVMVPQVLSASSINGDYVKNTDGERLGHIEDLMIDLDSGQIAYVVLSFGGFLGIGNKLFAIPWQAFQLDAENKEFFLNVSEAKLKNAPGFDKDNWPDMTSREWGQTIYDYYEYTPHW